MVGVLLMAAVRNESAVILLFILHELQIVEPSLAFRQTGVSVLLQIGHGSCSARVRWILMVPSLALKKGRAFPWSF